MKNDNRSAIVTPTSELSVLDPNRQAKARGERLRKAVKEAGGPRAVAQRAGVPFGTLNHYISGGEMKLTAAAAIAQACGVSIEWLATGQDSVGALALDPKFRALGATIPESSQPADTTPVRLFNTVHIGKLAGAIQAVTDSFNENGVNPPLDRIVQAALLLYDIMNDPESIRAEVTKMDDSDKI